LRYQALYFNFGHLVNAMNKIYTLIAAVICLNLGSYAQKSATRPVSPSVSHPSRKGMGLELKETAFDFGKIPQGRPVTHNFDVKNTGKTPLYIENVQASCGCTTPEWSQEPVAPGATTNIKVGFNAASEGRFTKSITITYNNNQVKTLSISGDVFPMPTTSAPLNSSLSLIK
jgi:hypothetical protein